MIIDVDVPSMDNSYEFKIDDNVVVEKAIENIVDMICQKEKYTYNPGEIKNLVLCKKDGAVPLNPRQTLIDCNVKSGESLILV